MGKLKSLEGAGDRASVQISESEQPSIPFLLQKLPFPPKESLKFYTPHPPSPINTRTHTHTFFIIFSLKNPGEKNELVDNITHINY